MPSEVPAPANEPRTGGLRPRLSIAGQESPHGVGTAHLGTTLENSGGRVARRLAARIGFSLATALAAGSAVTLWGPFEYFCGSTLKVVTEGRALGEPDEVTPATRNAEGNAGAGSRPAAGSKNDATPANQADAVESIRQALMDHAWRQLGPSGAGDVPSIRGWSITDVDQGSLRLVIRTTNRELAVEKAGSVAESLIQAFNASRRALRVTPSEGELALSRSAEQLRRRLESVEMGLAETRAGTPAGNPTQQQAALLEQWNASVQRYRAARADWDAASREAIRLGRMPSPAKVLPTAEERRAAQLADDALQQDLRELEVNLAELRRELLAVHRQCTEPLESLVTAVTEGSTSVRRFRESAMPMGSPGPEDELVAATEAYADEVLRFATGFAKEREVLAKVSSEPMRAGTLDAQEALRGEAGRFLFESGKRLGRLRAAMRTAGERTPDAAAFHVSHSEVTRAFQRIQQAHHRLEFALGDFDPRDNFRIDRAVRSAKGLHRRCRDRIERLDQVLADKALERARAEHASRLAATEQRTQALRGEMDAAIVELMDLQGEINQGIGTAQSYVRSAARLELLGEQAGATRSEVERMDTSLAELQWERLAQANGVNVVLTQCGILDGPVDLPRRLQLGGVSALVSFAGILFGSMWLQRR